MKSFWLCLLLGCLLWRSVPADPLFRIHVSTRQVTCVSEDWIGTTGGLRPRRGGELRFPGQAIRALCADWVATDRGLYRGDQLVDAEPTSALLSRPDGLVSGHRRGGLRFWKDGRRLRLPSEAPVHSLVWSAGSVWAATSEGLWEIREGGQVLAQRLSPDPATTPVTALLAGPEGPLVGTPAGVFQLLGSDWARLVGSSSNAVQEVSALAWDPSGELWVGTAGRGVFHGRPGQGLDALLESPAEVTALAWTGSGLLIGTPQGSYGPEGCLDRSLGEIGDNHITSLASVAGQLWAGTFQSGLYRLGPEGWRAEGELPSDWVNHLGQRSGAPLVRFSDGSVYARGEKGWKALDKRDGLLKEWTSSLGTDWIGTYGGYSLASGPGWKSQAPKPALRGVSVTCLARRGQEVWLGSQSGLFQCRAGSTRQILDPLSDSWVTALVCFQGEIWAGTFRGGLCRERKGVWERVGADRIERVHCLLTDARSNLWIGTPRGLVWSDGSRWRTYTVADGLPGDTIWSLEMHAGRLWIGTDSGLAEADPERLRQAR